MPGERERRTEAATKTLHDRWPRLGILSRTVVYRHPSKADIAQAVLDAADEVVPVVSEEWANSSEHPNWEAGWHAGQQRGESERWALQVRAERAEAAARDFANLARRIVGNAPARSVEPWAWVGATMDALSEALAKHPSFSGKEGAEG